MPLLHGFRIAGAENCMSFTAQIIELSGVTELKKPYWKYSIKDMDELLSAYLFFEGKITKRPTDQHPDYMEGFSMGRYFKGMAKLVFPLIKRLITRKK